MPELAYVNGEFLPLDRAVVHVEDRGFQFADSVYEVFRTYGGELFAVPDHLDRLERSLAAIDLPLDLPRQELAGLLQEIVRRGGFPESVVYLQITRGRAPRHRGVPAQVTPTVVMTVRGIAPAPDRLDGKAIRVITVPDDRWARCDIKSVGLLANVLAHHAARQAGADDALFVGADGTIEESTAANVFIVRAGTLGTPPTGPRLLTGVTRGKILEAARAAGIASREVRITQAELRAADEVFLSGTLAQITPVGMVDGHRIGDGRAGPVTARIYEAFIRSVTARRLG